MTAHEPTEYGSADDPSMASGEHDHDPGQAELLFVAAAFTAMPVAVAITDRQGRVVRANDAMGRYLPLGVIASRHFDWYRLSDTSDPLPPESFPVERAL